MNRIQDYEMMPERFFGNLFLILARLKPRFQNVFLWNREFIPGKKDADESAFPKYKKPQVGLLPDKKTQSIAPLMI